MQEFDGALMLFAPETATRALVGRTVAKVERDLILATLEHCAGNRTHAASMLGISVRTMRNKLSEYAGNGLPVPPPGGADAHCTGYHRIALEREPRSP